MNLRDQEFHSRRRNYVALQDLNRRQDQADQNLVVREEFLLELGFLRQHSRMLIFTRSARIIEHFVFSFPAIPVLVVSVIVLLLISITVSTFALDILKFVFPVLAAVIAYRNWHLSRINSTVDDALKRKDLANSHIMNHPKLLLPYVQSALLSPLYLYQSNHEPSDETKIDMYIYSEIDNLEFVFDKSNHNLIDDLFVMRAIKIFVARCENPLFRLKARELLEKGRYNHRFKFAAETLILVAEWRMLPRAVA